MPGYTHSKDDHQRRLRRIEGQIRGLQRMVDNDEYCIDILTQISAATRALQAVSVSLLDEHLRHCVAEAITAFDVEHEKRLHFVLVRRDGSGYQHLHPGMAADGTWSVPLTLPLAGSYRVFTDFKPTGGVKTTPALISRPRDSTNRLRTTVCSVQPPWTDTRSLWTGTSRPVNPPTWSRP
jgi:CsoR family transcriptional regulator, copper-sensing transcriptional repressor